MYQQRLVIVGAGIVGLSTAYTLLKQGMKRVTVLEQATIDHSQAASHGISRLLRFEYGGDKLYSEMVRLSLKRWQDLERISRRTLYTQTGLLVLGNENDNFTQSSYYTLRELGHSPERLTRRSCTQRFPQFNTQTYDMLTYNIDAGMLHASSCLQTLRDRIRDLGGEIYEQQQVTHIIHGSQLRPIRLQTASGGELAADRVVLATGSWVHRLLGELQLPVRLTRQYLLYFAQLPASLFGAFAFPAFIADDLYGFPIHNTCTGTGPGWLKAASHTFGMPAEPGGTPDVEEHVIKQITQALYSLLPALQDAELAHIDSCIYDVSRDEDFILDYLPGDSRIVFATGMTGHAFKFGLLLGEILTNLLCETTSVVPLERFQLARFTQCKRIHAHSVA